MNLTGKVALVTGASRGIGQATAIELAKAGADVVVNFIGNEAVAQETVEKIEALGRKAIKIKANVGDADDVQAMVDEAIATFGHIDILVNNAGITRDGLLIRMKDSDWDDVLNINLKGVYLVTKAVAKLMVKQRAGRIINMTSVSGVTVNAVAPGFIETAMTDVLPEKIKEGIAATVPFGRMGQPEEIASVVTFLASDFASYITGQVLNVDGGMVM